jgi:hypothetical protein
MIFKDAFTNISKLKKQTFKQKVSSIPEYDVLIMNVMKNYLESYIQRNDIIVRPSVGMGNYSFVPWICLLSNND